MLIPFLISALGVHEHTADSWDQSCAVGDEGPYFDPAVETAEEVPDKSRLGGAALSAVAADVQRDFGTLPIDPMLRTVQKGHLQTPEPRS